MSKQVRAVWLQGPSAERVPYDVQETPRPKAPRSEKHRPFIQNVSYDLYAY